MLLHEIIHTALVIPMLKRQHAPASFIDHQEHGWLIGCSGTSGGGFWEREAEVGRRSRDGHIDVAVPEPARRARARARRCVASATARRGASERSSESASPTAGPAAARPSNPRSKKNLRTIAFNLGSLLRIGRLRERGDADGPVLDSRSGRRTVRVTRLTGLIRQVLRGLGDALWTKVGQLQAMARSCSGVGCCGPAARPIGWVLDESVASERVGFWAASSGRFGRHFVKLAGRLPLRARIWFGPPAGRYGSRPMVWSAFDGRTTCAAGTTGGQR